MARIYISDEVKDLVVKNKLFIKETGLSQREYIDEIIKYCIRNSLNPVQPNQVNTFEKELQLLRETIVKNQKEDLDERQKLRNQLFGFMKNQEKEMIIPIRDSLKLLVTFYREISNRLLPDIINLQSNIFKVSQNIWTNTFLIMKQIGVPEQTIKSIKSKQEI